MDFNEIVGKKIKEIRKNLGWSQQKFGESVGYNQRTVSFWESGKVRPDFNTLMKICETTNTSPLSFLGKINGERPKELTVILRSDLLLKAIEGSGYTVEGLSSALNLPIKDYLQNKTKANLSDVIRLSIELGFSYLFLIDEEYLSEIKHTVDVNEEFEKSYIIMVSNLKHSFNMDRDIEKIHLNAYKIMAEETGQPFDEKHALDVIHSHHYFQEKQEKIDHKNTKQPSNELVEKINSHITQELAPIRQFIDELKTQTSHEDLLNKIEELVKKVKLNHLAEPKQENNIIQFPKARKLKVSISAVGAGKKWAEYADETAGEIQIPCQGKPEYAIIARGFSMEPDIHDGSLLLVRATNLLYKDGDIVIAYLPQDNEWTVKQIFISPDRKQVKLRGTRGYEEKFPASDVIVQGVVEDIIKDPEEVEEILNDNNIDIKAL